MRIPASLRAFLFFSVGAAPLTLPAQTAWVGTSSSSAANTASNWNPATVPGSGTDVTFDTSANTFNVTFGSNSAFKGATFSGTFNSNGSTYFLGTNNSSTLSLGADGITVSTTGTGSGNVNFGSNLPIVLTAAQTWTTNGTASNAGNLSVSGNISGANNLTKAGSGYLALSGTNSFSSLTINAGTVYLGSANSVGSGTITVASGAALGGQAGDVTLSNAISLASGSILGSSLNGNPELKLSGTVTLAQTPATVNVASNGVVTFSGTLTGPSNTALTVASDGTGGAKLTGTTTNVASVTANNAAVAFGATPMPASISAINGGYVSVLDTAQNSTTHLPGNSTIAATFLSSINPTGFNGVIGFDRSKSGGGDNTPPTVFTNAIDLSAFTVGSVKLGSASAAVLTGTITPPTGATSYDFGGFAGSGGLLVVQSALGGSRTVNVTTPANGGGVAQNGLGLVLQGDNNGLMTGNGSLTVTNSGVILDSANALPASSNFSLGNYSYVGYTENTGYSTFADFASHLPSGASAAYTSTSILGIDTGSGLSAYLAGTLDPNSPPTARTVGGLSDPINLSGYSAIYLGTFTGVTLDNTTLTAPSDGALRLVSLGDTGNLTLNSSVTTTLTSLVVGMPGTKGAVVLNNTNTFSGGTTLLGGQLQVGNSNAIGTGALTVGSTTGDNSVLAASSAAEGSVTLSNDISVTDFLQIGTGKVSDTDSTVFNAGTTSLTLTGTISNVSGHNGRLYITAPTTMSGPNTYSGGTYVEANTVVTTDTGLGTSFVDIGYGANLTFTSSNPTVGSLSDASNFIFGAGKGNIALGSGTLNLNGSSNGNYTGVISGTGGLTRSGSGFQTLGGNNTFTGIVTISSGGLVVSTIGNGGVAGNLGAASNAAANLVFDGGTLQYNGNSSASTDRSFTINSGKNAIISVINNNVNLTITGAGTGLGGLVKNSAGILTLAGTNTFAGATSVNGGKLFVNGSLAGAVNVLNGSTLAGSGTISGLTTIQSGSHLAPGSNVGTLTFTNGLAFNSGSILDFDLGTSSDKIFVTGGSLSGPVTGNITLNLTNSTGFVAGTYTLIDFTGASNNSFDTTDFAFGQTIGGFNYSLAINSSQLQLTATAVPEPSTYAAILGAAALGGAAWRRRRRAIAAGA